MHYLEILNTVVKKSSHAYLNCTGFYCCSLWCKYKCKTCSKVKVAYNIFWILMDHGQISVSQTMIEASIDPFNVVKRKYIGGFSKQLGSCENVIVKTLYNSLGFQNSKLFNVWCRNAYSLNKTI